MNDEAILPNYSYLGFPAEGGNVTENRIAFAFARLLTPTLAFTVDSGWIRQNWPQGRTSGFDTTEVGLKYEAYRNNQHETLVSVGLAWGIAHSGAKRVSADAPNTILPGVFFGKGFGDLPDALQETDRAGLRDTFHSRGDIGTITHQVAVALFEAMAVLHHPPDQHKPFAEAAGAVQPTIGRRLSAGLSGAGHRRGQGEADPSVGSAGSGITGGGQGALIRDELRPSPEETEHPKRSPKAPLRRSTSKLLRRNTNR